MITKQQAVTALKIGKPYLVIRLAKAALNSKQGLVWPRKLINEAKKIIRARKSLYREIEGLKADVQPQLLIQVIACHNRKFGPIGKEKASKYGGLIRQHVIKLAGDFEYSSAIELCNQATQNIGQLKEDMSNLRLGLVLQKYAILRVAENLHHQIVNDSEVGMLPLICLTLKIWAEELEFPHPYHTVLADQIYNGLTVEERSLVLTSLDTRRAYFNAGPLQRPCIRLYGYQFNINLRP